MTEWLDQLPPWVRQALGSALAIGLSVLGGLLVRWLGLRRLRALVQRSTFKWDDVVVEGLSKRVVLWSTLLGTYFAAGLWAQYPKLEQAVYKLVFLLAVLSVTFFAAGIITRLAGVYSDRLGRSLPGTSLTQNIARGLIIALGALVALNGLGISVTPLLTALGVGGLAVALALQDTLANLFAGIYVTLSEQLRLGDYVKLDTGQEGYVTDIGWRTTQLRMLPNNLVVVPNAKLAQAIVINFHLPDRELAVLVEVGVDYGSDLAHVERVTCEVGREAQRAVKGACPEFEPFIRFHTFADSSVNFSVILRAQEFVDQYLLKHEFIKRLHERYRREGITIPFPIRTIVQASTKEPAPRPG